MKQVKTKVLSVLLSLCMVVTCMVGLNVTASAMQVYIQITGESGRITIEMEQSDSIENLKAKIQDKTHISPSRMTLTYNNVVLEDETTIHDNSITSESTLILTVGPIIESFENVTSRWDYNASAMINIFSDGWSAYPALDNANYRWTCEDYYCHTGYKCIKAFAENSATVGSEAWLYMPTQNLSGCTSAALSFYYMNLGISYNSILGVYYSTDDGENWVELFNTVSEHYDWTQETIELPSAALTDNVKIGFKATYKSGKVYLDDVMLSVGGVSPQVHNEKTFTPWTSKNCLPSEAGSYYLTSDVTIDAVDRSGGITPCAWAVPDGTVNLCLNGHSINVDTSTTKGSGIVVPADSTLNLYDCGTSAHKYTVTNGLATVNDSATGTNVKTFTGGYITGGYSISGVGGGISVRGTLNMYGGTIIGNQTNDYANGGGVYVFNNAEFTMSGGSIIGNSTAPGYFGGGVFNGGTFTMTGGTVTDNYGSGIYLDNTTTFELSGAPFISGNIGSNVLLANSTDTITITDVLSNTTPIGVTKGTLDVFTSGYSTYNNGTAPSTYFRSDKADYAVFWNFAETEAKLAAGMTLSYDANGATSGTAPADSTFASASEATVADNTGALEKTGASFSGWNTAADGTGTPYTAGDTFTISVNTTLYAQWTPAPDYTLFPAVPATCTEDGNEEYYTKDGKYYTKSGDDYTETTLAAVTIPALGHNYKEKVITPATCTEDGESEFICSRCKDTYTRTKYALGHSWDKAEYVWSDDLSTCTGNAVCKRDKSHTATETVTVTTEVTKEAKCTTKGSMTYTAEFTNKPFRTQTKTVELPALGHDRDENGVCKRCGDTPSRGPSGGGSTTPTTPTTTTPATSETKEPEATITGEQTEDITNELSWSVGGVNKEFDLYVKKDGKYLFLQTVNESHTEVICGVNGKYYVENGSVYNEYTYKDDKFVKTGTIGSDKIGSIKKKNDVTNDYMVRYKKNGKLTSEAESLKVLVKTYYKPAVKATAKRNGAYLKWEKVGGATKYRLSKMVNGKLKKVADVNGTSINLTGLKSGKTYTYAVKALINDEWTTVWKSDLVTVTAK